jgi:hypothetical protein
MHLKNGNIGEINPNGSKGFFKLFAINIKKWLGPGQFR